MDRSFTIVELPSALFLNNELKTWWWSVQTETCGYTGIKTSQVYWTNTKGLLLRSFEAYRMVFKETKEK